MTSISIEPRQHELSLANVCRACGHRGLELVMAMGRTPLANALLTPEQLGEPEATFVLDLAFCPRCTLVQLTETVPPEELFSEYLYFSSFSDTMLRHAQGLVARLISERGLSGKSQVVEVASNDGYLLQYYQHRGIPVLGIEPAANIAQVARETRGIRTICEFFGVEPARRLSERGERADVIHAHNVMAHVPDINGFVQGIRTLLKDKGVAVIEVPYVRDLIEYCEFDTIYHEHLFYFSLTALDRLFDDNGLMIERVERVPIHGGSLRLFATRREACLQHGASVVELLEEEEAGGIDQIGFYRDFASRTAELKQSLRSLVAELKGQGKRIAVYGASAKGATLLNYFGLDARDLDFVVDRSTIKQGRYTPGTRLPIHAPKRLLEEKPDYVLLLAWNLADEILQQQQEYRNRGGRFIVPIPELRVI